MNSDVFNPIFLLHLRRWWNMTRKYAIFHVLLYLVLVHSLTIAFEIILCFETSLRGFHSDKTYFSLLLFLFIQFSFGMGTFIQEVLFPLLEMSQMTVQKELYHFTAMTEREIARGYLWRALFFSWGTQFLIGLVTVYAFWPYPDLLAVYFWFFLLMLCFWTMAALVGMSCSCGVRNTYEGVGMFTVLCPTILGLTLLLGSIVKEFCLNYYRTKELSVSLYVYLLTCIVSFALVACYLIPRNLDRGNPLKRRILHSGGLYTLLLLVFFLIFQQCLHRYSF